MTSLQTDGADPPVFRNVEEPGAKALQALVERIAMRVGRLLEKRGLVERDIENAWLAADATGSGPLDDLLGHSITYRIAVGPRAGQKLFTLQTVPARLHGLEGDHNGAARAGGFSLHAGLDIQPGQRAKLERLCRYVSRPPVATERLAMTSSGQVRYQLKTPYRDGTTHIVMEPLDLMARLAALIPPPRMHRGCSESRSRAVLAAAESCASLPASRSRRSSRASWRIWRRQLARRLGRSSHHWQHGRRLHNRDCSEFSVDEACLPGTGAAGRAGLRRPSAAQGLQADCGRRAMVAKGFAVLAERFTSRIARSGPPLPSCGWT
jgi:hypothetical protein